jgi:hypothetical protein
MNPLGTVHLAEALKTPAVGLAALYPLKGISAAPSLGLPGCVLRNCFCSHIKVSVLARVRREPGSAGLAAARPRRGKLCSHDTAEGRG